MKIEHYILCLDTDKYAGNFERETTAYATGQVGECGVGDGEAEQFAEETDDAEVPQVILREIADKILSVQDEHGCYRPCAIQVDEDGVYHSVGIYFSERLGDAALRLVLSRAEKYLNSQNVVLLKVRLITKFTAEHTEVIEWK